MEPKLGLAPVEVIARSPTGIAMIGQTLTRLAVGVQALAAAVGGVFALFLPAPWAVTGAAVCAGVYAVCGVITGASPGVRREPAKP